MDKIPNQTGYLILQDDGAVLESGGDLENDERVASIVTNLITIANRVDPVAFGPNDQFSRITITYDAHCFIICQSNKKIHIIKKTLEKEPISNDTNAESLTVNA